jgi:hypothetical protein
MDYADIYSKDKLVLICPNSFMDYADIYSKDKLQS